MRSARELARHAGRGANGALAPAGVRWPRPILAECSGSMPCASATREAWRMCVRLARGALGAGYAGAAFPPEPRSNMRLQLDLDLHLHRANRAARRRHA